MFYAVNQLIRIRTFVDRRSFTDSSVKLPETLHKTHTQKWNKLFSSAVTMMRFILILDINNSFWAATRNVKPWFRYRRVFCYSSSTGSNLKRDARQKCEVNIYLPLSTETEIRILTIRTGKILFRYTVKRHGCLPLLHSLMSQTMEQPQSSSKYHLCCSKWFPNVSGEPDTKRRCWSK